MKPEKQLIAIANACPGVVTVGAYSPDTFFFSRSGWAVEFDPLNDLNAMHEAEKELVGEDRFNYCARLTRHTRDIGYSHWNAASATAAQRAEAFLRTLGKWEESA